MSPVHVIVGEDPRAEAMWADAFAGAIDLYRFGRNAEAFERLTAAEAPVDLVILTPAQGGPFNLTPDQFVARVLESPLSTSRHLANLHVVVVGSELARQHPRAVAVPTMDAAIRLVKFGHIESAPRPVAQQPEAPRAVDPLRFGSTYATGGLFSDSVISRIWDAADAAEERAQADLHSEQAVIGGGRAVQLEPVAPSASPMPAPLASPIMQSAPAAPQLFERAAMQPTLSGVPAGYQVSGGGAALRSESIEVASGGLASARPYTLPNGGAYRGPEMRQGQIPTSSHHSMPTNAAAPVPPALVAQVQQVVYGTNGMAEVDPMLVWSSSARGQVVTPGVPVPGGHGAQVVPGANTAAPQPPASPAMAPAVPAALRTVPMDPPAGVYPTGAAPQPAPHMSMAPPAPMQPAPMPVSTPTLSGDPFLRRAEQDAAVSYG